MKIFMLNIVAIYITIFLHITLSKILAIRVEIKILPLAPEAKIKN